MARKIAGLWCFNKEPGGVKGMHVNTTEHVSLWLYVERDGVQEWHLDSGVGCSANRVRTAAKAYALAWSGVRVDDSEMRYATAEIGEIPEAVLHDDYEYVPAENDTQASCYTLNAIDVEHGWKIGMDKVGHAVCRVTCLFCVRLIMIRLSRLRMMWKWLSRNCVSRLDGCNRNRLRLFHSHSSQ